MKIIARKPAGLPGTLDGEYIVVDRGPTIPDRYVSTFTSSNATEWRCKRCFKTLGEAIQHFNRRQG